MGRGIKATRKASKMWPEPEDCEVWRKHESLLTAINGIYDISINNVMVINATW